MKTDGSFGADEREAPNAKVPARVTLTENKIEIAGKKASEPAAQVRSNVAAAEWEPSAQDLADLARINRTPLPGMTSRSFVRER